MQPTVEVLPSNRTLPKTISMGPKRLDWLKKHPEEVGGVGPGVLSLPRQQQIQRRHGGRKSRYATPEGQELIKRAFEMYRGMGELRSLTKVAVELNLPDRDIKQWCWKFKWNDQIVRNAPVKIPTVNDAIQYRLEENTLRAAEDLLKPVWMKIKSLVVKDEVTGEEKLSDGASVTAMKELANTLERIAKNLTEKLDREKTKQEITRADSGGGGNGSIGGVIVNVNLLGLVT